MKWLKMASGALALATVLSACTKAAKPNSPEGTLEAYVTLAFNVKKIEDRQKLLDLSTGEAQRFLTDMPNEVFRKQFVETPMQFVSMKAKDLRQEQSGDVSLVYELSFKEGKTPNAVVQTNKKIAYLTRDEKGDWKIKATKNVKSVIERKDDLEVLTPETTEKEQAAPQK